MRYEVGWWPAAAIKELRKDAMSLHIVRHEKVLEILDETSSVRVARLAEQLQVSEMTVRRDLQMLEEQGKLRRVHGGAVLTSPQAMEPVSKRAAHQLAEKQKIGALAARLIEPGMHAYIGGGSTTKELAEQLSAGPEGRFSTNSIEIAETIARHSQQDVCLLGGSLRSRARTLIGPETIEMLERRVFDLACIGIAAIDPQDGFLEPTEWHAWLVRTLRRRAGRLAVLADHSKFRARSDFRVLDFEEVDVLVTDRTPPEDHLASSESTQLLHASAKGS